MLTFYVDDIEISIKPRSHSDRERSRVEQIYELICENLENFRYYLAIRKLHLYPEIQYPFRIRNDIDLSTRDYHKLKYILKTSLNTYLDLSEIDSKFIKPSKSLLSVDDGVRNYKFHPTIRHFYASIESYDTIRHIYSKNNKLALKRYLALNSTPLYIESSKLPTHLLRPKSYFEASRNLSYRYYYPNDSYKIIDIDIDPKRYKYGAFSIGKYKHIVRGFVSQNYKYGEEVIYTSIISYSDIKSKDDLLNFQRSIDTEHLPRLDSVIKQLSLLDAPVKDALWLLNSWRSKREYSVTSSWDSNASIMSINANRLERTLVRVFQNIENNEPYRKEIEELSNMCGYSLYNRGSREVFIDLFDSSCRSKSLSIHDDLLCAVSDLMTTIYGRVDINTLIQKINLYYRYFHKFTPKYLEKLQSEVKSYTIESL